MAAARKLILPIFGPTYDRAKMAELTRVLEGILFVDANNTVVRGFSSSEYLDDQLGDGSVKTFTFTQPVDLFVAMLTDLSGSPFTQEGRAVVGLAQAPTSTLGAILRHQVAVEIDVRGSVLQVYAPTNTRLSVYGRRR